MSDASGTQGYQTPGTPPGASSALVQRGDMAEFVQRSMAEFMGEFRQMLQINIETISASIAPALLGGDHDLLMEQRTNELRTLVVASRGSATRAIARAPLCL